MYVHIRAVDTERVMETGRPSRGKTFWAWGGKNAKDWGGKLSFTVRDGDNAHTCKLVVIEGTDGYTSGVRNIDKQYVVHLTPDEICQICELALRQGLIAISAKVTGTAQDEE